MKLIHNEVMSKNIDVVLTAFDTVYELSVRVAQAMEQGLAESGLNTSRAEVLFRLRGQGPMVQRELSQALRCTPRHVTGLVDALQSAGLVERQPHPTDRRATLVVLTTAGTKLATGMFAGREASAREMFGDVPERDLVTTVAVLRRVLDGLDPPASAPAAPTPRLTT